jgi:hypothetical protein
MQQGLACVTINATAAWSSFTCRIVTSQHTAIYIRAHKRILNALPFSQSSQTPKANKKMGTRHLILVYYKGQYRICQYGQWDGQPDGQGLTCLHFLLDTQNIMDLRKVLDHSDNCIIVISDEERTAYFTDLQRQQRERGGNPFDFPGIESLSRDTGANILNVVAAATPEEPVKIHL